MSSEDDCRRRTVLKSLSAGALASVTTVGVTGAVDRSQASSPNTDFDPASMGEVENFITSIRHLGETERERLLDQLSRQQAQAYVDGLAPAQYVVSSEVRLKNGFAAESAVGQRVEQHTADVAFDEKWGWSAASMPDNEGVVIDEMPPSRGSQELTDSGFGTANNCGVQEWEGSAEVSASSWLGFTVFTFESVLESETQSTEPPWDFPWLPDCSPSEILDSEHTSYGQGEDFAWNYQGEIDSNLDSGSAEAVSYKQGYFSGPSVGGVGYNADPYIELKQETGFYWGTEIVDKSNGV